MSVLNEAFFIFSVGRPYSMILRYNTYEGKVGKIRLKKIPGWMTAWSAHHGYEKRTRNCNEFWGRKKHMPKQTREREDEMKERNVKKNGLGLKVLNVLQTQKKNWSWRMGMRTNFEMQHKQHHNSHEEETFNKNARIKIPFRIINSPFTHSHCVECM